jgi:hypothetical protein
MIPLSLHYKENPGGDSHFSLRMLVLFLFLIAIISGVTANPISPRDGTQYTMTTQIITTPEVPSPAMEWKLATPQAEFSDRLGHSTVVYDDSIWVIGGINPPSTYFSEIWRSDDGVTWRQVTPDAAFGKRAGHGSVVFDNKIWVIGGRDGNTRKPLNDVWYSSDGVTWTRATSSGPFAPRWDFGITVFEGKMWILGGSEDGITHNDVWYSSDGITWIQATPHADFSPRMEPSATVYKGKIWVTGGFDWKNVFNDVWTSNDGVKWELVSLHAQFVPRRSQEMETADGKLWVIGGSDGKRDLNDVWYTTDGISWTQASDSKTFTPRFAFTTAVFNNRTWVIAGTSGNDIWYSGPSLSSEVPSPAPLQNMSANVLVTKSISPSSIKQGTDTRIKITVLNRGPTPIHDVEILDEPQVEFPVVDGSTQTSAQLIEPDDTRILTYTVRATKAGSYRLNKTAVMYADVDGNYQLTYSSYTNVRVFPSLLEPAAEDPVDDFFQDLLAWIKE